MFPGPINSIVRS